MTPLTPKIEVFLIPMLTYVGMEMPGQLHFKVRVKASKPGIFQFEGFKCISFRAVYI